jgi:hypothetical protein
VSSEIELSLTLSNLEEIERWILSWGTHARVIAPPELKERIAQTVSELAENYLLIRATILKSETKSDLLANTLDIRRNCRHTHMLGANNDER